MQTTTIACSRVALRRLGWCGLAVVVAAFASCTSKGVSKAVGPEFASLAGEMEFWRGWFNEHSPASCPLEPLFCEEDGGVSASVDDELRAIAKTSESFVLVIRVNVENGLYQIVSLAKDKHWQQTEWQDQGEDGWKKSVSEPGAVNDDVLTNLSGRDVYVDVSDKWVFHADSVYVFLRHQKTWNRLAVYNPQYEEASQYEPDDDTGKKVGRDPVAASLKTLFETIRMADAPP